MRLLRQAGPQGNLFRQGVLRAGIRDPGKAVFLLLRGEKNFLLYDLKKFAGAGVLDGPEALRRRKPPRAGRIRPLRVTGNMVIKPPAGSSFMAWQPTLPCRVWGRMLTSAQPAAPAAPRRYLPAHRWTGWRFPAGRRIRKGSGRHRLPVDSARSYAKNCIL